MPIKKRYVAGGAVCGTRDYATWAGDTPFGSATEAYTYFAANSEIMHLDFNLASAGKCICIGFLRHTVATFPPHLHMDGSNLTLDQNAFWISGAYCREMSWCGDLTAGDHTLALYTALSGCNVFIAYLKVFRLF